MRHEKLSRRPASASEHSLIRPVILSGGSGTRLWPLSRPERPKQLLPLVEAQTMLQATVDRVAQPGFADPLIVSGEDLRFLVRDQLEAAGVEPAAILLEPQGRNTAAAVALAAYWLVRHGSDDIMLVMPSDHLIGDVAAFNRAIEAALPAVHAGALATFGIKPHRPETGYGYIRPGTAHPEAPSAFVVSGFFEKPDAERARRFCDDGYLWNGGIFLFRATAFLTELERYAPEIARQCEQAIAASEAEGRFVRPQTEAFLQSPNVSIDVAVMERTSAACVVPVDMGWSDVGSWNAVWEISPKDDRQNAIKGDVIAVDTHGSLLRNETGLKIAVIGVENLVIIATGDSILIVPRDRAQEAGKIAAALK